MIEVIPAILPKSYEDLKQKIGVVRGLVSLIQIDICDGVFTPSQTWPFNAPGDLHFKKILNEEEGMPFWQEIDFELDLMVVDAVSNFDLYSKLGGKRMIFHIESVGNIGEFRDFLEGIDPYMREMTEIGVALNPGTSNEQLSSLINLIDFVQLMGNDKIGYHGIELDEKVLNKIKDLRNKYVDLLIAVDIGVNQNTAHKLISAGATKLIAGSAIFGADDIIGAIENLKNS